MQINLKVNTFVLEKWDDERALCTFYTVRWDGGKTNETDLFLSKCSRDNSLHEPLSKLVTLLLEVIGDRHGAKDCFFNRDENEVKGLPPKGKIWLGEVGLYYPAFPIRLYALKLSRNIVILFGGGVKDGPTNQTSSLLTKWREACRFCKAIDLAIHDGEVIIDYENRLIQLPSPNQDAEILLYI